MLKQFVTENGLTAVQLLNTHCHLDHVFGNKWVSNTFGLELHIHANEEVVLQYAPISGQKWGLPFEVYKGPFNFLSAGDTIALGSETLKVLFTPGHSPGSISFYHAQQQFVVSGDILFNKSIGRTDLPFASFEVLQQSILQQLYTLPDATTVYSGHGTPTTIGYEKKHNPYVFV
jgi:glyoxylase-like metal-dependent hydrolase (beta-lactamase superfamily II)